MTDTDPGPLVHTADFPFPHHDGLGPLDEFAALRSAAPCARIRLPSGDSAWLVTRYADVRTVLADPRFSRTRATRGAGPRIARVPTLPDSILAADPPEHTRLRKLVAPAFTGRRAEAMRRDVARLVEELLDQLAAHDRPADLVQLFARPLPLAVICALLGVPRQDGEQLDAWCDALRNLTALADTEVTAVVGEMTGYLTALVAAKRRHPGDDVLSTLIAARDESDRLSQDELISFSLVLLAGGTAPRPTGSAAWCTCCSTNPDGTGGCDRNRTRSPGPSRSCCVMPRPTSRRISGSPPSRSNWAASRSPRAKR